MVDHAAADASSSPLGVHAGVVGGTVTRLGQWAASLQPEALSAGLRERALLQLLSAAGALHASSKWSVLSPFSMEDAASRAGRIGWLQTGDRLLMSDGPAAAVAAAWSGVEATPVDRRPALGRVLIALIAANEVSSRLGLSALLAPVRAQGAQRAAAAAVARGVVDGVDGATLAHGLALALVMASGARGVRGGLGGAAAVLDMSVPTRLGLEAMALARAGVQGPLGILDRPVDGIQRLATAFTGLGTAWLSQSLSFGLDPLSPGIQVPVQGVQEILRRHIKAADKRLRADQVERVVIRASLPSVDQVHREGRPLGPLDSSKVPWQLANAVALRIVTHESGVDALEPSALAKAALAVADVAQRVEVHHDPARTALVLAHRCEVLAPLLSGLGPGDLKRAMGDLVKPGSLRGSGGDPWKPALHMLALRPDRLLARVRRASPDLGAVDVDAWRERADCEVVLDTTRGGRWPERRELPEGSPGWPWADTVDRVCGRFAGDEPDRDAAAQAIRAAGDGDDAGDVCEQLLA